MKARVGLAFAIVFSASASAQKTQHTQATTPPRVAAIAAVPNAMPATTRPAHYGHGAFRSDLPILLMGDGRVFADFGRGWEQISRSCSLPSGYSAAPIVSASGLQQPVVVQPTVTQPSAPGIQRLPYTPPVPVQQTASQQMAANGGRLPETSGVGQSCWARAQDGRVVVTQP